MAGNGKSTNELGLRVEHGIELGHQLSEQCRQIRVESRELGKLLLARRTSIGRDLSPDIRKEIRRALHLIEANPRLQGIVGSWGRTTSDMEVLANLQDWNSRFEK